jgi:hypothetical protein
MKKLLKAACLLASEPIQRLVKLMDWLSAHVSRKLPARVQTVVGLRTRYKVKEYSVKLPWRQ